ncbi:hypothetical protein KSF73_12960 [Burkholderiaceae bacterium DAT-1]|nr:hypothetical protein [Burkholderiaceae bacterium DAT-1]
MDSIENKVESAETPVATVTATDKPETRISVAPKRRWLKITGWILVVLTLLLALATGICVHEGLVVIDGEPAIGLAGFGIGMAALAGGILIVVLAVAFAIICAVGAGVFAALIVAGALLAAVFSVLAVLSPILVPIAIAGYVIYRIVRKPSVSAS